MTRRLAILFGVGLALLLLAPRPAEADFPGGRPILLIMPFPPGGPANAKLRALAAAMSRALGTEVNLINRGGSAGERGWLELAAAPADGHTIGFLAMPAFLAHYAEPSWGAKFGPANFTPLARAWAVPYGIAVPVSSSVRDLAGLIERAKARPGEILVATGGRFSAEHILLATIERAAGVRFATAHFSFGPPVAAKALAGSHVDAMVASALNLSTDLMEEESRVLAVASEEGTPLLPGIPTMRALGLPAVYEEHGVLAGPAGLPPDVVARLEAAVRHALADPQVAEAFRRNGAVPSFRSSAALVEDWPIYDTEVGAAIRWMRQ